MKLPARARSLARRSLGMGRAEAIAPEALLELVAREPVVVISVGMVTDGALDPRLPGVQRVASLRTLARAVADLPRERAIVLHCG